MKTLVVIVTLTLLSLIVLTSARPNGAANKLGRVKRGGKANCERWMWWCYFNCNKYDDKTEYCCFPKQKRNTNCCSDDDKRTKPSCDSSLTYHKHECSCNMYWICMNGEAREEYCPTRGVWDDVNKECKKLTSEAHPGFCDPDSQFHVERISMIFAEYTIEVIDENGNEVMSIAEMAPHDVVFNVLKHIEGITNNFSVTTEFDPVDWWIIQCVGKTCVDDSTEWKFLVDGKDMTSVGVNKVIADSGKTIRFVKMKQA